MSEMDREADRWMRSAASDLKIARFLLQEHYYHACAFHAQQAAEKALKGVLRKFDRVSWGHSCRTLLTQLNNLLTDRQVPERLFDAARHLDRHYIPSRYPDAYSTGTPADHYGESVAKKALDDATAIMQFVQSFME